MNKIVFRQFSVAFLLFVIAGAFFFCAFSVGVPMGGEAHAMPTTHEAPMTHSTHLDELTLATVVNDSFALNTFMLAAFLFVSTLLRNRDIFRSRALVNYIRQKFHDIIYCVQKIVHDWLALFELSPSFA